MCAPSRKVYTQECRIYLSHKKAPIAHVQLLSEFCNSCKFGSEQLPDQFHVPLQRKSMPDGNGVQFTQLAYSNYTASFRINSTRMRNVGRIHRYCNSSSSVPSASTYTGIILEMERLDLLCTCFIAPGVTDSCCLTCSSSELQGQY